MSLLRIVLKVNGVDMVPPPPSNLLRKFVPPRPEVPEQEPAAVPENDGLTRETL